MRLILFRYLWRIIQNNLIKIVSSLAVSLLLYPSAPGFSAEFSSTMYSDGWLSSRDFLNEPIPKVPDESIYIVTIAKAAILRGFQNISQAQKTLELQKKYGNLPKNTGYAYLGPKLPSAQKNERLDDANGSHEVRWALLKNAKTFAGSEVHFDFVPEKLKKGFRFGYAEPVQAKEPSPEPIRYGLILKNIEPSDSKLLLVMGESQVFRESAGSEPDLAYYASAPKAKLSYDIGPIGQTPEIPYLTNMNEEKTNEKFWQENLPSYKFKAKLTPKSLPTASKPIPDQSLSLDQVEGLYGLEARLSSGFHKDSLTHRFNIPLYGRARISEEYSEKFKPYRLILTDLIYSGPYGSNFEHNFLEKRYQAGLYFRQGLTALEINSHLTEADRLAEHLATKLRWELNLIKSF